MEYSVSAKSVKGSGGREFNIHPFNLSPIATKVYLRNSKTAVLLSIYTIKRNTSRLYSTFSI